MKVVITYDSGDGMESSIRIIGFETDTIENLHKAIRELAEQYQKDLPDIEKKVSRIYKDRRLSTFRQDEQIAALRRDPYMLRYGKYQLWAGEFVVYQLNYDQMVKEFVEPEIVTLEEWFEAVTEKGSGLH